MCPVQAHGGLDLNAAGCRLRQKLGRKAANAYFAGNHSAAKSFSQQARERRAAAEELNAKAAEAIFRVRNPIDAQGDGHVWGLDLHGLHASEAVQAVQHRLAQLERMIALHASGGVFAAASTSRSSSTAAATDDSGPMKIATTTFLQRPLKVITGAWRVHNQQHLYLSYRFFPLFSSLYVVQGYLIVCAHSSCSHSSKDANDHGFGFAGVGTHSRGGASIPSAVKNYLLWNE